jgi:hypothetical protein
MAARLNRGLLRADSEDLFVLDFNFDAEGRANITALDDGAADPDVTREVGGLQRIVESAAAGITDKRMIGEAVAVLLAELIEVTDVLEGATAIGGFAGESPVACGSSGGAGGETHDGRRDIFACGEIADKEVGRGPGFGQIREISDDRVVMIRVGEGSGGVWRRRRHLDLRSRFEVNRLDGARMRKPADAEE